MTAPATISREERAGLRPTTDPTADALHARLHDLSLRLEQALDVLEPAAALARQAPLMAATAVDTFDALVADGKARGIDVDERLRDTLGLLERLTAPDTVRALNALLRSLPALAALAPIANDVPDLLDAARRDARPLGLLGTLGALREPEVQTAVGLAVAAARLVGRQASPSQGGRAS